jgi:hypothetical protein
MTVLVPSKWFYLLQVIKIVRPPLHHANGIPTVAANAGNGAHCERSTLNRTSACPGRANKRSISNRAAISFTPIPVIACCPLS